MGAWYWIGVAAGLGAATGVLFSGLATIEGVAIVLGSVAGAGLGEGIRLWQPGSWGDVVAGGLGGLIAAIGAGVIVGGARRRGGTRFGTAAIVGGAALLAAGLAWVPVIGYLEALALPVLARRLRRRQPERYAGLRTLAKD